MSRFLRTLPPSAEPMPKTSDQMGGPWKLPKRLSKRFSPLLSLSTHRFSGFENTGDRNLIDHHRFGSTLIRNGIDRGERRS